MSTLLLMTAALGLIAGAALMVWPLPVQKRVRPELVEARTGDGIGPATYLRRILGAMLVGASLFLGGFTLAWRMAG